MLKDKVNKILMEMSFLDTPPNPDAQLKTDLGIDSLRLAELLITLEEHFNILINESFLEPQKLSCVKDIYYLISNHVKEISIWFMNT